MQISEQLDEIIRLLRGLGPNDPRRKVPYTNYPEPKPPRCVACGIELSGVMMYSCPRADCTTGLGPVMC